MAVERQRRHAAAAGDADGEVGARRHRYRAAVGLQEDRRQPRIGGRRDPGLQFGRRRRDLARQGRLHRLCQPRRRIVAGDRDGGHQGDHQRGTQRAWIAPRQAGPRHADAQPAHRAHRARDMHLPQRHRRGIGSADAARRPIGQHRQRPMRQPGRKLQAAIGRLVVRRGKVAQPVEQQPEDQQPDHHEQRDMPPRRQQARQVEQCGADEQAGNAERRPQGGPDALEQDRVAGERPAAGKPAQQAIELSARGVHCSQCGMRSPRHKSACALTLADHRPVAAVHHHLGRHGARIVGRTHHRAIGAGIEDRHPGARRQRRQHAVARKGVARLADRSHHVGRCRRRHGIDRGNRHDAVPCIVHGGTDQVVHRRVEHDEAAALRMLCQDDGGQQHARRPDQPASRLHHHAHIEVVQRGAHRTRKRCRQRRRFVAVRNAEPAAAVDDADRQTVGTQRAYQVGQAPIRSAVRCQRQDLAADMRRQSNRKDAGQLARAAIQRHGIGIGNTELVLRPAGGDLGMRAGIDIRIDPQDDARRAVHRGGDRRQHRQLLGAFHVDLRDVLGERQPQFAFALADAREHDAVGRDACRAGAAQLALADDVGAGALGREQPQHREPVVRLHRVMDVRIQAGIRQRSREHPATPAHGRRRIDPDRRADAIGDGVERHIVDHQPVHRVHREMRPRCDQLGGGGIGCIGGGGSGHDPQSTRGRRPQEPLAQQRRLRTLIGAVAEFQPNAACQSGSRDCHPGRWRMGTLAAWTGPRGARGRLYPARHRRHLGRCDPCQPSLVRADAPRDRGGVRRYGAGGPQCARGTAGRFRPAASGRVHLPGVQAARQRSDRRAGPAGNRTGKQGHRPRCAGRAPLA